MMPKSVKRFSDDIMLYFFDLETDSDFRSNRPEIIRLQAKVFTAPWPVLRHRATGETVSWKEWPDRPPDRIRPRRRGSSWKRGCRGR
ncbi:hypothetical protein FJ987_02455 [Mesorhizobium sp. CU2]|nr:hypothetical protein FJ988_03235 [Mesorhizobium sp. CU3]TPO21448.1 hypothetical protein FJ987_02455 [Mesorhizobium sp. CU2]